MRNITCTLAAVALLAAPGATRAANLTWQGVNVNALNTFLTDIGDVAPFDLSPFVNPNVNLVTFQGQDTNDYDYHVWGAGNNVPGPGDTATFTYGSTAEIGGNVEITAGAFNPDHLVLNAGNTFNRVANRMNLRRDLQLQSLRLTSGNTSGGQGDGIFFVDAGVTLTLAGDNPLTFGGNRGNWSSIELGGNATLRFTGANQTLDNFGNVLRSPLRGDATNIVEFANASGSIHLGDPGANPGINIHLNQQRLRVHANQTWTAAPTASIFMTTSPGARDLIESISGERLDNLGEVNLRITRTGGDDNQTDKTTGNRLVGGTYGSLEMSGGSTSHRNSFVVLKDHVTLLGNTVVPASGGDPGSTTEYGLLINSGNGNNVTRWFFDLDGFDLDVTHGVRLADSTQAGANRRSQINAQGSTITIGGNLHYDSVNNGPDGSNVNRLIGIVGDAGTVVRLKGDFDTTVAPMNTAGLSLATVNLVSGNDVKTFEVGDAAALSGVQSNSYSIGTLNIGDGFLAGTVMLVNEHLNGNPFTGDAAADKLGEKLIVGTLNINAGSTLIANLGSASVEIGPATLHIDPTGMLDLLTGMTPELGDIVPNFVGLGDQTSSWSELVAFVIDSTNPGYGFAPTLNQEGNTVWQFAVGPPPIPEPASLALVGLGGLLLLARRRRRG